MNYLKPLLISASLFAVSFTTFAYNNNYCDGTWHRGSYHNQQQYNNRPCDGPRHYTHSGRHNGMMQYSTSIQTAQPSETLKKIAEDTPKGENGKQYLIRVSVIEVLNNDSSQNP
ncbi:hypothetical protein AB7W88_00085 [Providencia vermicola]|uniref:Secreted protein n=3 Tax=Providencia TaxID=586 RepID=A0AAI9HVW4_PROST|nr:MULTISPECIES: hypothetical protein [Providencia]ELR5046015.1 hypothetical protein [Providencia rettgeri]ELR5033932.1 hypothetical protein [Providencia stuartii]ELR5119702.1 hypothetical protein [Providencia stuartii]ELR5141446.1 hypothetical protein [Providencia stuartii]ELR5290804.1 hypothetical protein [Providencia stuartii]